MAFSFHQEQYMPATTKQRTKTMYAYNTDLLADLIKEYRTRNLEWLFVRWEGKKKCHLTNMDSRYIYGGEILGRLSEFLKSHTEDTDAQAAKALATHLNELSRLSK